MSKLTACAAVLLVTFFIYLNGLGQTEQKAWGQAFTAMVMAPDDQEAVVEALKTLRRNHWRQGEQLIANTRNPLAAKLYLWLYYTKEAGPVQFERVASFLRQYPDWPGQRKLQLVAEKNMPPHLRPAVVIDWFSHYPPLTMQGMDLYLKALLEAGKKEKIREIINPWWKESALTLEELGYFLTRYGIYIEKPSHKARLSRELQRQRYHNARILARNLGSGYPELAEARIALARGAYGVDAAIARVPPRLQNDSGLLLERLKWRRRNKREYGAIEILQNMPPAASVENPEEWWDERHALIREFIARKNYEMAYLLAEKHVQEKGVPFAEAEFVAGWLALRYLNKPWRAFEHFEALYHRTSTPISRSRGAYWAGQASDVLGHPDIAKMWYTAAARHQTAFYGQMALSFLPPEARPGPAAMPLRTLDGKSKFEAGELPQIIRLLARAGLTNEAQTFLEAVADTTDKPSEFLFLAELASEIGQYDQAVKIAKKALQHNVLLMDSLYPTLLDHMRNVEDTEWALVHALIRQESGFRSYARSHVGAQGLMQLMPATAKGVAQRHSISYRPQKLSDPDYNIRLGALYLKQMLDRYDGAYPLALAAYNAGPGRVSRWLGEIGDPRTGEVGMVDWIESIPYSETRNYVQRVLENVYIYRIKFESIQPQKFATIHMAMGVESNQNTMRNR